MKNKQGAVSYFEETYEISLPRRFFISEKTSASSSSLFLANFSRRPICHTYSFISVTLGKLRRRALLPVPARRWTLSTWLKASGELAEGDGAYESDHAWAPVSYDRAFLATRRTGQWGKMHCFIRPPFLSTTLYCTAICKAICFAQLHCNSSGNKTSWNKAQLNGTWRTRNGRLGQEPRRECVEEENMENATWQKVSISRVKTNAFFSRG